MKQVTALISTVASFLIVMTAFVTPLLFFPFTADLFDFPKRVFFIGIASLLAILWAARTALTRKLTVTITPWTVPFLALGASAALSIAFASPNKIMALSETGGVLLAMTAFVVFGSSLLKKGMNRMLENAVIASGIILSLSSLAALMGAGAQGMLNSVFGLKLPDSGDFSLTGGIFIAASVMIVTLVLIVVRAWASKMQGRIVMAVAAVLLIAGIGATVSQMLPGRPLQPFFLSLQDSWSIGLDVLKAPRTALFGVGTDSYFNAYTFFRPVGMNQGNLWFARFDNARNSYLEFLTTQGIIGLAAWVLILLATIASLRKVSKEELPLTAGILAIMGLFILFPPNSILLIILSVFIVALTASLKERGDGTREQNFTINIATGDENNAQVRHGAIPYIAALGVLAFAMFSLYFTGRVFAADIEFGRALAAIRNNNAKDAYDRSVSAITLNPYNENYRRSYALTNLSLAQAITQKEDITEQDQQTALTLVQQAIQEAKATTSLNPSNTSNWESLASVYQSLIGVAEQADQWTIAAMIQAIQTDPSNPQLRFNLGSVYRTLGNKDQAIQLFLQAIQLKGDYANAYYNLADIYKEQGDEATQLAYLQQTLQLIPQGEDYDKVKEQVDALSKVVAEKQAKAAAEQQSGVNTQEGTQATPRPSPRPAVTATPAATATPNPNVNLDIPESNGLASPSGIPEVPQQ